MKRRKSTVRPLMRVFPQHDSILNPLFAILYHSTIKPWYLQSGTCRAVIWRIVIYLATNLSRNAQSPIIIFNSCSEVKAGRLESEAALCSWVVRSEHLGMGVFPVVWTNVAQSQCKSLKQLYFFSDKGNNTQARKPNFHQKRIGIQRLKSCIFWARIGAKVESIYFIPRTLLMEDLYFVTIQTWFSAYLLQSATE